MTTRREATIAALSRAAMDVFERDGVEGLTADAIAEEAGVSRRTFFNHFGHVDEALTAPIQEIICVMVGRFHARPPEEPLRTAILAVLEEPLPAEIMRFIAVLHREAARTDRGGVLARRFMAESAVADTPLLEAGLRERIGPDADPLYVAGLAAAFVAVIDRVTALWVAETGGDLGPAGIARHHELTHRAVEHLMSGYDESAATTS